MHKYIYFLLLLLLPEAKTEAQSAGKAYVFAYFKGNGEDGLHLAASRDGWTWKALKNDGSFLTPTVGKDKLMRDPCVIKGGDGLYHMVWTVSWTDKGIGYANSRDLITWSPQQFLPVMIKEAGAMNCWAPEITYDDATGTYMIYWATTIKGKFPETASSRENSYNHRIYYILTKDFHSFSDTRLLYDPGFNVIDATIVKEGSRFAMFLKDETPDPPQKNIKIAYSQSLAGPYSPAGAPITGNYWAEGPTTVKLGNEMVVYFDKYTQHHYGAVSSSDWKTWKDISTAISLPKGIRHGTIVTIGVDELAPLTALGRDEPVDPGKDSPHPVRHFNPIIPDNIADPSVVMVDSTFYLYATTDVDQGLDKAGPPVVWKSRDFVNWHFEGILQTGIDWNKPYNYTDAKGQPKTGYFRYWAPGKLVKKGGRYYLFVTIVKPDNQTGTYVMIADKPEGPFAFADGATLDFPASVTAGKEARPVAPDIDGEPFIDDDGSAYLYWRMRKASALSDDLLQRKGDIIDIPTSFTGYSEGPGLFKRGNLYYYFYTLSGHASYSYGYMISRKGPLGPFESPKGNNIFIYSDPAKGVWGPGHGNVFHLPGTDQYYFVYLEYGEGSTTRQVYVNSILFNEDGTIQPVQPDQEGVGYLRAGAPGDGSKRAGSIGPDAGVAGVAPAAPRDNLAVTAKVTASSSRPDKKVTGKIAPSEDWRIVNKDSATLSVTRVFNYLPGNAAEQSYRTRWRAEEGDKAPWIQFDLGTVQKISSCEMYFVLPAYGTAWVLEKSADGNKWEVCGEQKEIAIRSPHVAGTIGAARFLRLRILKGEPGLWEMKIFK